MQTAIRHAGGVVRPETGVYDDPSGGLYAASREPGRPFQARRF